MRRMQPLTDRSARITAARTLLRRRYRDDQRRFLVEGPQVLAEALPALVSLFVTEEARQRHGVLIDDALGRGVDVATVTDKALAALSETVTPQGLVGVAEFVDVPLGQLPLPSARLIVILDQVRDPGNAGTALRVADAAGADAVIFTNASVDPYNGKCVRASAGSVFHLPVVRGGDATAVLAALREARIQTLATSGEGKQDLFTMASAGQLTAPTAWLFGNEAHGLSDELAAAADVEVSIPIFGRAESLNVATATAVCLYASAYAQREH